ncbi:PDR/VanB family oxidoreductase [Lacisediminihabitans profunda]|uniref:Oxidoreductase n=1 Tax=Lacisediminihabitans profunda TaxID=2594790 RepID=A0A5C8UNP9_9MICO|nr:PDR/VanB family oxidoreductase [Lacisediminihabitans profunda]TXN30025.1 oxidoreductase [Lacisediminihabitans profunda]
MTDHHETELDTVVVGRSRASDDVDIFELRAPDGAALPAWTPGAHIDVILPGIGERQYSLVPAPAGSWRIGVLREPTGRGGSAWLHSALDVGAALRVRGPRNHFAFAPPAGTRSLFLAGGVGITPIAAMVDAAAAAGVDFTLHYSGRSRSSMALVDELSAAHQGRVVVHASDEGDRLDLDSLFADLDPDYVVYCCGPAHYIDAVETAAAGRPLHVERFEAKTLGPPVLDEAFEVELAGTGVTVTVPPERSILDLAEEAGAFVLSSCREGTCGTCETVVLEGEVDHRDSILTPDEQAENTVMYICVSRAAGPRLVLDL